MRRLVVLAVMIAAACALSVAPAAAQTPKRVPFQKSVTVTAWGPAAYQSPTFEKSLAKLKKKQHIDTVTLLMVWAQDDKKATTIHRGGSTAPDKNLKAAIRAAKKLKLRVVLRPYVDVADGSWRGQIEPSSRDAWFTSYTGYIRKYAGLAQKERVDGIVVGSEMTTLSGEEARWRALVAAVRKKFKGWVTYQANWGGEENSIKWWDAVDVISISAYYPVSAAPGATTDQLTAAWFDVTDQFDVEHKWYERIDTLRQKFARPVMFGEIGYRPVPMGAVEPWNLALGGTDTQVQPRAYEAAFRVWYRVPWFRGMHWWNVPPEVIVGQRDAADHEPLAASLRVLARWYKQKR